MRKHIYAVELFFHIVIEAKDSQEAEYKVRKFIKEYPEDLSSTVNHRTSYDDLVKGEEEK